MNPEKLLAPGNLVLSKFTWYNVTWFDDHNYDAVFDCEVIKAFLVVDCQKTTQISSVWSVSALEFDAFLPSLNLGKFYFYFDGSDLVDEHFIFEEVLVVVEPLELFSPGTLISIQYTFWKTVTVNHFMIINSDIHYVGDQVRLLMLRINKNAGTGTLEKITLWKTREKEWVSSQPGPHHEKFLGRLA
jgi:hypothetical protein